MSVIDIADDTAIARSADAVLSPAEQVTGAAGRVGAALMEAQRTGSREAWLAVTAQCQHLVNTATAMQDAAIVQIARRENVWCEDGTLGETRHTPGRVTIDTADLVAPAIGASHAQAQRRVEQAVRLAGGLVPVEADDRDLPVPSGLDGLHQAMSTGQLDGFRASVIAFELDIAPAHVADAVVAALSEHLGDDAPTLRRRTRVLLSHISPDLVRERATRARASTGLRRWVAEPGVDEWHGTFPSEDAATAWAAIDRLAHDLVLGGTCTTLEQARGKALTDLVTGNATIDVQVVLTVPADTTRTTADTGAAHAGTTLDGSTASNSTVAPETAPTPATPTDPGPLPRICHSPSVVPPPVIPAVPGTAAPATDPAGTDQTVAASDHAITTRVADTSASQDARTYQDANGPPTHSSSDEDLVQVQGARPSEPLLVRRGWLRDHLATAPPPCRPRRAVPRDLSPQAQPCDPLTGARLDPDHALATAAYTPGAQLAALVRARDGRCRFPGCSIPARSCDLDHVRPWPTGPTAAANLLTLCRRHHRIKQHPGWRVSLAPDGTTTWSDPAGHARTTTPLDALASLVLAADPANDLEATGSAPEVVTASGWSALETHLEIAVEHHAPGLHLAHTAGHIVIDLDLAAPAHRRCTSATQLRDARRRRTHPALAVDPPF